MKKIILSAALGCIALSSVTASAEPEAVVPAAELKSYETANAVIKDVIVEFKTLFSAIGETETVEQAKALEAVVELRYKNFEKLSAELEKQKKPTDEQMKKIAPIYRDMEKFVEETMKTAMPRIMGNPELAKAFQAAMMKMQEKPKAMDIIEAYYPEDKMDKFVEELKKAEEAKK